MFRQAWVIGHGGHYDGDVAVLPAAVLPSGGGAVRLPAGWEMRDHPGVLPFRPNHITLVCRQPSLTDLPMLTCRLADAVLPEHDYRRSVVGGTGRHGGRVGGRE